MLLYSLDNFAVGGRKQKINKRCPSRERMLASGFAGHEVRPGMLRQRWESMSSSLCIYVYLQPFFSPQRFAQKENESEKKHLCGLLSMAVHFWQRRLSKRVHSPDSVKNLQSAGMCKIFTWCYTCVALKVRWSGTTMIINSVLRLVFLWTDFVFKNIALKNTAWKQTAVWRKSSVFF